MTNPRDTPTLDGMTVEEMRRKATQYKAQADNIRRNLRGTAPNREAHHRAAAEALRLKADRRERDADDERG